MRSILYRKFIHINDQILFTVVKRKSNHPRRTKNEHKNLVVVDNIYISKYLQRCVFDLFCIFSESLNALCNGLLLVYENP